MKTKIIAAASVMAVAVAIIAAIVVANPFGRSETMGGGEESMHSEGMSPLSASGGEERFHSEGAAPLTVNIETEKRIIERGADGGYSSDSATPAKPYIGVAINENDEGAVRVMEVLEDGPSKGILRAGDVITAVDGEAIGGSKDLVEAIADAGAGASLALTVTRDGGASDVKVSVGEFSQDAESGIRRYSYSQTFDLPKDGFPMKPSADFDFDVYREFGEMDKFADFPMMMDKDILAKLGEMDKFADFPMMMDADKDVFDKFGGADDFFSLKRWGGESGGIARMEKSARGEDGAYQTHRMAAGTVTNVNPDARTFTLQPQDGSAAITYSVSDGAKTLIAGSGGVGGLTADGETPTLVVDVDGDAQLILQGEDVLAAGWGE